MILTMCCHYWPIIWSGWNGSPSPITEQVESTVSGWSFSYCFSSLYIHRLNFLRLPKTVVNMMHECQLLNIDPVISQVQLHQKMERKQKQKQVVTKTRGYVTSSYKLPRRTYFASQFLRHIRTPIAQHSPMRPGHAGSISSPQCLFQSSNQRVVPSSSWSTCRIGFRRVTKHVMILPVSWSFSSSLSCFINGCD